MPDREGALTRLDRIIGEKKHEKDQLHQLREELSVEQLETFTNRHHFTLPEFLELDTKLHSTIEEAISERVSALVMRIERLEALREELPETLSDKADQGLWTLL